MFRNGLVKSFQWCMIWHGYGNPKYQSEYRIWNSCCFQRHVPTSERMWLGNFSSARPVGAVITFFSKLEMGIAEASRPLGNKLGPRPFKQTVPLWCRYIFLVRERINWKGGRLIYSCTVLMTHGSLWRHSSLWMLGFWCPGSACPVLKCLRLTVTVTRKQSDPGRDHCCCCSLPGRWAQFKEVQCYSSPPSDS